MSSRKVLQKNIRIVPSWSSSPLVFSSSGLSSKLFGRLHRKLNNYCCCCSTRGVPYLGSIRTYHCSFSAHTMISQEENSENVEPLEKIYNTSYKNCIDFLTEDAQLNIDLGQLDKREAVKVFPETSLQRCRYCWMIKTQCLCGKLKPFSFVPKWVKNVEYSADVSSSDSLLKKVEVNLHLHFLMHKKEFHKSTNSVKILLHTDATQTAHLYIDQHEMHEAVIKNLIDVASQPGSNQFVYILFPSADSQTVAQTLPEDMSSFFDQARNKPTGVNDFHFHVFVLDGTWNEARMLNRRESFKGCKRIKVDVPTDYNYVFKLVRTGKVEGRISTLEAVTLLLRDFNRVCNSELSVNEMTLKESEESPDFESSIQSVYDNLNTMIDISDVKFRRHGLVKNLNQAIE